MAGTVTEVPALDLSQPLSITRLLDRAVALVPTKAALSDGTGRIDYATLDRRANQAAHLLQGLGVAPGDRVAVALPNDTSLVVALLAVWKLGAVFVGVHRVLAPPEKAFFLDDSGATVLIADPATAAEVRADLAARTSLRTVVAVGGADDEWAEPLEAADDAPLDVAVDPLALAAIAYTSGTTGRPKGVMHSQHNALLPGAVSVVRGSFGPDEPIAVVLPLTILNVMILNPLTTLNALSTCVLCDRHDARAIAARIRDEQVVVMSAVPTVFYDLLTDPAIRPEDLATLTKPRTGGATMPEATKALFTTRFGVRPVTSYAMTEGPTLVTRQDEYDEPVEGSCGRALPHIDVRVLDEAGSDVAVGERGEICFGSRRDGPWAGVYRPMLGYWGRPDETAAALRDGLVHSGDLGRLDADGQLFLVERRSQLIIRGGSNIYPAEVEQVLARDPRIAESCVVGRPDDRFGEEVVAYVRVPPGTVLPVEDLVELCRANLARYKVPSEFFVVESLPRTALGKVARVEVQRLAAEGRPG